jgi:hypothetical protein
MFETWRRRIIIFLFMVIAVLLVGIIYTYLKKEKEVPQWSIDGVVQRVKYYDARGEPEITVNGKTYFLEDWYIHFGIEKGDSIYKAKGSMEIKLIKHKTGKIIILK